MTVLAVVLGVALLAFAADQFVLGAARVALIRDLSPMVVGIVIIGFGTSCPELLVSALAAADDRPAIAIGNIVGSNIANLSLLLGIGAFIIPLVVASSTVRREAPITLAATVAFALAVQGGGITVLEGALLLIALGLAIWKVTSGSAPDVLGSETEELASASTHRFGTEVARTVAGLAGTVVGAQLLLWGAVDIAERAGLAQGFVGATLVAVGTSLPELVTVIQSARRREPDLIVGNLLGSNLFNALGVGGVVGLVGGMGIDEPALTGFAVIAASAVALIVLVTMIARRTVGRVEGVVLVVLYATLVPFLS